MQTTHRRNYMTHPSNERAAGGRNRPAEGRDRRGKESPGGDRPGAPGGGTDSHGGGANAGTANWPNETGTYKRKKP